MKNVTIRKTGSLLSFLVFTQQQAQLLVAGVSPGEEVEVIVIRDHQRIRKTVIATERSGYAE